MNASRSNEKNLPNESRSNDLSPWIIATTAIVIIAMLIRLALNFRHALLPGTDAAYYPMQSQWLILHGELSLPAMPLIFHLQAILAKAMMAIFGTSLEESVCLSARLFDGCVQPLTAIPIMLLGFVWSTGRRSAVCLCAAAAVLSVMSPPIMRMAGDLQKNSLGMMWMAVNIWAMRQSLASPRSRGRWVCLAIVFVLAGVSHIGAFGVTGVILVGSLLSYAVLSGRLQLSRQNVIFIGQVTLAVALVTLFIAWLVPSQVQRISTTSARVVGFSPAALVLSVVVYTGLFWVLQKLYLQGNLVPRCDLAIAIGSACGVALLVAPVFSGVWVVRFQLMTPVPVAALLSLVATKFHWDGNPRWRRNVMLGVLGLLALVSPAAMQGPVISKAAADELRELKKTKIVDSENTLVVAPHGMEFWAGYLMRTRVKRTSVPRDVSSYDRVLLLKPSDEALGHRPQPHHSPGFERGPMVRRQERQRPEEEPDLIVPSDAKIIYQSQLFTLYEI